nr:Chain Q, peptide from Fibrinogen alpha chain [Homo sapiens]
ASGSSGTGSTGNQ